MNDSTDILSGQIQNLNFGKSRVALVIGTDRRQNIAQALQLVEDDLAPKIHGRVLIKPNLVSHKRQLPSTHVEALRAVLDTVTKYKPQDIVIAEGAHDATTGFARFGYLPLAQEYPVRFFDLNKQETEWDTMTVQSVKGEPLQTRISRLVHQADCRISVALPKVHTTAIVTLSLKNMMSSIAEKDRNQMHGYGGSVDYTGMRKRIIQLLRGDSPLINLTTKLLGFAKEFKQRGRLKPDGTADLTPREAWFLDSVQAMNHNLVVLGRNCKPHIGVVDGWWGMDGEGPRHGFKVNLHMAVASADCVAADAVASKIMGFEPMEVGYLFYANEAGLGRADLSQIEVLGDSISSVARQFKPNANYFVQRQWRTRHEQEVKAALETPELVGVVPGK